MKILKCEQGSAEWFKHRVGVVTASEFKNLVSTKWEIRTGEMPKSYLARKLAEWWLKGPLPGGGETYAMETGILLEERARPWYELERGVKVDRVGFILSDCGRWGCSPDGLIGEEGGLEIKCPQPATQISYLLLQRNGPTIPPDYEPQVFFSLWLTGRAWWDFLSYCPGLPPVLVRVEAAQHKEKFAVIEKALAKFDVEFESAKKYLQATGWTPDAITTPVDETKTETIEAFDIIP